MKTTTITVIALLLAVVAPAAAEWSHDIFAPNIVEWSQGRAADPHCVTDDAGNTLVIFLRETSYLSGEWDVVVQRLDVLGVPTLGTGVVLAEAPNTELSVCPDGNGGAYVVYGSGNAPAFGVANRVGSDGQPQWSEGRILSPLALYGQSKFDTAIDQDGSLLITWVDNRNAPAWAEDVFVQKFMSDGVRAWSSYGQLSGSASSRQLNPHICSDGTGGAFVIWDDNRQFATSGYDLYFNQHDTNGTPLWTMAGMLLSGESGNETGIGLIAGTSGRFLAAWNADGSPTAALVDDQPLTMWLKDVTDNTPPAVDPACASDGHGGIFLAWSDTRSDGTVDSDIYAQWIDASGYERWAHGGVGAGPADGNQYAPVVAAHPDGGAALAWIDGRGGMHERIFTQHLQANGSRRWGAQGLETDAVAGYPDDLSMAVDARAGVVACWKDAPTQNGDDIAAMRIDRWGFLGDPSPAITGVVDYPQDQGGVATVSWAGSYLDDAAHLGIDHYSVWRRQADAFVKSRATSTAGDDGAAVAAARASGLSLAEAVAVVAAGWAYEASVSAALQAEYAAHVPTYGDSTAASVPLTEYKVLAHAAATVPIWESGVGSGYSRDNLAPSPPLNLMAAALNLDAVLYWTMPRFDAEDLDHYRVYRGVAANFTPGPTSFVGEADAATFTDSQLPGGTSYFKVTAVDVHGNEGAASAPAAISGAADAAGGVPTRFALCGAWPNPFNPSTQIAFDLPAATHVKLVVMDARGRVVRTLVDGSRDAGRSVEIWDGLSDAGQAMPSGVYFAHLSSAVGIETKKLVLVR
jgi:hypothetical protein